jgi:chemotaxis protein MotB
MRAIPCLAGLVAVATLPACGIPTEQYDARTAELRQATERLRTCDDSIRQEQQKASDAQAGLEEMRAQVRDLTRERRDLGITSAADAQAVRAALADASRGRQAAAERKSDRERLSSGLKAELDGGVIWLDERGGQLRLVLPEEALFGPTNAQLGPNSKKVLDAIVAQLQALPPRGVMVSAYLDKTDRSNPDKDTALTLDRAWRVSDYLGKHGIDKSLLAAAGYGELEPIADNQNEAVRQRNRRVEVALLSLSAPAAAPAAPRLASPAPASGGRSAPAATRGSRPTPTGFADDPGL